MSIMTAARIFFISDCALGEGAFCGYQVILLEGMNKIARVIRFQRQGRFLQMHKNVQRVQHLQIFMTFEEPGPELLELAHLKSVFVIAEAAHPRVGVPVI